jgi:hypothetical protein
MRVPKTVAEGVLYGRWFARQMALDDASTEYDTANMGNSGPDDEPQVDPVEPLVDWAKTLAPDELEKLIQHLSSYQDVDSLNEQHPAAQALSRGPRPPVSGEKLGVQHYQSSMKAGASPVDLVVHYAVGNMLPEEQARLIEALKQIQEQGSRMAGDAALKGFESRFPGVAGRIGHMISRSVANRDPAPPLPLNPSVSFTKDARQLRRAVARVTVQATHGGGSSQPPAPTVFPSHSKSRPGMALDRAASGFAQRFPDAARIKNADGRTS